MNYRNAKYIDNNGRIDCEIEHPVYGWIPYTLDPNDTDTTVDNDELLALMTANADVATYVPASVEEILTEKRTHSTLTRKDFCINAYKAGLLSETDAILAAKGDWPSSFSSALSSLTADQIVEAKIEWASVVEIRRTAPLLLQVASASGVSDEVLDSIFGIV
jgi:hypothetical protein